MSAAPPRAPRSVGPVDPAVPPAADPAGLPAMDVPGRLDRLRAAFPAAGLDALLVTQLTNVRYLTGFTGSNAVLIVGDDAATLVTDGRYASQAPAQLAAAGARADVEIAADPHPVVAAALGGARRLGLEAGAVTWAQQRVYGERLAGVELVPTTELVELLRLRKDAGEVARIEAAAGITDAAVAAVLPLLLDGATELDVAAELDHRVRRLGASGSAFETIVAAGLNGALPHARPTARPIAEGDLVVIDVGATVDGYRSDMTRTYVVGEPTADQRRHLDVVAEAQAAGVAAVAPGAAARDVDAACREVIEAAGWGAAFVHGTGHGVGLDIHEAPGVNGTAAASLAAGQVITVEPGVYLPGTGGVRVEDTVVVTDQGCRPLTCAPKP